MFLIGHRIPGVQIVTPSLLWCYAHFNGFRSRYGAIYGPGRSLVVGVGPCADASTIQETLETRITPFSMRIGTIRSYFGKE